MRILIISQYWAPENGVPQRRWSWLTEILTEAGHSVTVLAPPPHYDRQIGFSEWWKNASYKTQTESNQEGLSYSIVRTGFIPAGKSLTHRILNQAAVAVASVLAVLRRSGELRYFNPDLVIGTVPALPTAVVTFIASKRFRVPYLVDLRDAWPDLIQDSDRWNKSLGAPSLRERILSKGPLQFLGMVTTIAINFSLKRAAAIIVTSSRLGEELRKRPGNLDYTREQKLGLVRNVFPPEVDLQRLAAKKHQGESLNILYAGTLGRAQNLVNAIEAAELAADSGYEVRLRLVGAGAAKRELVRVSRGKNVSIEISSKLAPEDLIEHYRWSDTALVHLTDWQALNQAVPSKTYELMSIGKHISAVVSGETAELIQALEAGHVVRPEKPQELANLWIKLVENPELLDVSNKGAEWVHQEREQVAPDELRRLMQSFER